MGQALRHHGHGEPGGTVEDATQLALYEEVARRYSEAPEAPVRERVAEALNDAGVVLIFEARSTAKT